MPAAAAVALLAAAYFLGTFPTASVVARGGGRDPTAEGSGNPGASNVFRLAGARSGALVLAGDVVKGLGAAGAGLILGGRAMGIAAGGAAVVGHCFPLGRMRQGGKGVAALGGMALVLYPVASLVVLVAWAGAAAISGKASLASLLAVVALPAVIAGGGHPGRYVTGLAAVSALVVLRHRANIARLARGQEPSLRADRTSL